MIGAAIGFGMVAGLGAVVMVRGFTTPPVRLGDALALLDSRQPTAAASAPAGGGEALGGRVHRRRCARCARR